MGAFNRPQSRIEELLIEILENGGGGGGGGGSLTSPLVASVDVGGIQSGKIGVTKVIIGRKSS